MTTTTRRAPSSGRTTSGAWVRVLALIAALFTALAGSLMLATGASADAGGTPNDHASSAPGHTTPTPVPEVSPGTQVTTDHPDNGGGNDSTKDQSPGNSGFHKVSICHWTGNAGWIVITMSQQAWAAHDAHQGSKDDYVTTTGSCATSSPYSASGMYCVSGQSEPQQLSATGATQAEADAALAAQVAAANATAPTGGVCPTSSPTGGSTPPTGSTGGTPATATSATGVTPLPATAEESASVVPLPATVIPPKAAQAGGGSSAPTAPTAAWILLITGALGIVGTATRLVTAR